MGAEGRYHPRVVDEYFRRRLASMGALAIQGPMGCGKTTTASSISLRDPDYRDYYIERARAKPSLLLERETPRLIDEWQDIPKLWDATRFAVDRDPGARYILAGSALPKESDAGEMKHSGAGRISNIRMRTMSLFESGDSNGEVSLGRLFDGEAGSVSRSDMTPDDLAFDCCFIFQGKFFHFLTVHRNRECKHNVPDSVAVLLLFRVQVNAFDECLHELLSFRFGAGTPVLNLRKTWIQKYSERVIV